MILALVFLTLIPTLLGIKTPQLGDSSSVVLSPALSYSLREEYVEFTALLSTVFAELSNSASSIIASEHFQTIQTILLKNVGPTTGKFLIRWGFLLYVSYSTTQIVHDIYMYKSILEDTGYQLHQYEEEFEILTGQCQELMLLLTKLSQAIYEKEYEMIVDEFRSTFTRINGTIYEMKAEVSKSLVLLEEEESFHLLQQKKTFVNGLGTCVYTLGSLVLTAVYPPSLPWLVASKASSVLGLGLSSWNFFTSYVEGKNVERVKYRIRRFLEVSDMIEQRRNVTVQLLERFEYEINEYERRKEALKGWPLIRTKLSKWWGKNGKSLKKYVSNIVGKGFHIEVFISHICYYSLIGGWIWLMVKVVKGGLVREDGDRRGKDESTTGKKVKVMLICVILFYFFSLFVGIQIEEANKLREKVKTSEVDHDQWEERYQKECIWWELSVKTQLYYEVKSIFFEFIPFLEEKGIQELTMNEDGELIQMYHCKTLKKKIEMFKKNQKDGNSNQEGVVNAKMDSLFVLFRNIFRNTFGMMGEGIEKFVERTSFTSKLWLISIFVLFVLLYFKR